MEMEKRGLTLNGFFEEEPSKFISWMWGNKEYEVSRVSTRCLRLSHWVVRSAICQDVDFYGRSRLGGSKEDFLNHIKFEGAFKHSNEDAK